jgi:hypothetical protein
LYDENFDATQLDIYDQVFLSESGEIDEAVFENWTNTVVEKLAMLQDKIQRAEEKHCAEVLLDGIVLTSAGGSVQNIDFKRKSTSKIDLGTGNYWATSTIDPLAQIETWCEWLRTNGKVQGGTYVMILGTKAASDLLGNPIFQQKADNKKFELIEVGMAQSNSFGAVPHCKFKAGSYLIQAWTYPEFYQDSNGNSQPYIDPKKVILLPEKTNFTMEFGAVPTITPGKNAIMPMKGEYHPYDYIDPRETSHVFGIKSASIPVPVAIDTIFTAKVVS